MLFDLRIVRALPWSSFLTLLMLVPLVHLFGGEQDERRWNVGELYQTSTSRNIVLDSSRITLDNHLLVEDDAPGCGYSSNPSSVEILKEGIVLKKTLLLKRVPVRGASVVAMFYPDNPPQPNNGRHVVFTVNGHDIPCEVRHFWPHAPVPAEFLKQGENIILVRTQESDTRFKTWIALDENFKVGTTSRLHSPNRSARSTDGGKTWDDAHLGVNGNADGEYTIRLALNAYQPEGWLQSAVIDLAPHSGVDFLQQPVRITSLALDVQPVVPSGTGLQVQTRSGLTHSPGNADWSQWKTLVAATVVADLKGRYMQFRILMTSSNDEVSPAVTGASIKTTYVVQGADHRQEFAAVRSVNHPLVQSSFPFEQQNPHEARLREFRSRMKLDSVVGDARTEFEKMLRIKSWVAKQWEWHLLKPEEDIIRWDALAIMTPGADGKVSGGFCLHYAIVLMQALQSFGFPARVVSVDYSVWGGHEVVEAWSNEFGKWIFLDANFDTYFVDKATGKPMNVLEMHRMFLKEYFPGETIDRDRWSREDLAKRAQKRGSVLPVVGMLGGCANSGKLTRYEWWNPPVDLSPYCGGYGPLVMGYLRYMPRANYISEPYPVPVNHGRTHWGWTGYYCWFDPQTPRSLEHELFTNRDSDLYWNLNQVDFRAEIVGGGVVRLEMATNSPDFSGYVLTVNGVDRSMKKNNVEVVMERGLNRIEMRVVDSMGNKGTPSSLECIYLPAGEQN